MSYWGWVSPYSFFQNRLSHSSSNKVYLITIYRGSKGITAYLNEHCLHTSIWLLQSVKCLPSTDYFSDSSGKQSLASYSIWPAATPGEKATPESHSHVSPGTASSCTSKPVHLLRARKIRITVTQPLVSKRCLIIKFSSSLLRP